MAAGILAVSEGVSLEEAIRRVVAATGQTAVKIEVLSSVRKAIGMEALEASPVPTAGHRLLVTGASGFIGSSLMTVLGQKYETLAPTSLEIDLVRNAIGLDLLVKDHAPDTVIHLANPRLYQSTESIGTALGMLKNVLDVCVENELHLIFPSSWAIYSGYKARGLRADESLPPYANETYGYTKLYCEDLIRRYHDQHGLSYTILRLSPVYGLQSDRPRFIWTFLQKALRSEEIVTHKYANGFPILDLLNVGDVPQAIAAVVERRVEGSVNIGTGVGTSTAEIARLIVEHVGSKSDISHVEIEGYASNVIMDISKAERVLDWTPKVGLKQGLESIVRGQAASRVNWRKE
ncbi:MAG: NAD(P)-dependent oxidoreductase [Thaumarchaeota archaeon]|nr:NAD(P)-dependent oxidoreductase [Nitrososphaerota archaeon]